MQNDFACTQTATKKMSKIKNLFRNILKDMWINDAQFCIVWTCHIILIAQYSLDFIKRKIIDVSKMLCCSANDYIYTISKIHVVENTSKMKTVDYF